MTQEGSYQMVPDKLTGAQTTDGPKYVGATKAGKGGAAYVFGYFPGSVPAGAAIARTAATDYTSLYPWVWTTAAGGAAEGVARDSVAASAFGWMQTAGTLTVTVSSAPMTANTYVEPLATAGSWSVVAIASATAAQPNNKIAALALYDKADSASLTTAAIQLIPINH